ncbi:MAG TPA: hypothetical protein VG265_11245 [Gaiellaceae bacterium]|nr:hypothetical protein [Gaiellaceae bacterium]
MRTPGNQFAAGTADRTNGNLHRSSPDWRTESGDWPVESGRRRTVIAAGVAAALVAATGYRTTRP